MTPRYQKTKLILVGYRATGKSTLAARLAERWGFDFYDTDDLIEQRAGKKIADIFRDEGEAVFRDLEEEMIAELLETPRPMVIATGGGAPMRDSTRELMKERGVVVWLTASVETIAARMSGDSTTATRRPSLTGASSPVDEVARVLEYRTPIYRDAAHLEIATDSRTVDEIVEEIVDAAPEFFF